MCDAWKYKYVTNLLVETSLTEGLDSPEDELSESIIIDDKPRPNPRRRAQRRRVPTQSPEMVNWTSKEYETRSAASLSAAWKEVWKQWGRIHTNADRQLAQILDPFHEIMSIVQCVGIRAVEREIPEA
jgi:hypothetical protein